MPSDLPPAPAAAVSAAGGGDASVVDTIFTSTIRSSKKGKHPILPYLEIYANFELQRSYTPASVKKIVPPSSQHWAKIRPANSALHTFSEGRELSWGVATPTSRMAQYLVGNPTKNKLCLSELRGIDDSTPAGSALAAISTVVHPYMQSKGDGGAKRARHAGAQIAAAGTLSSSQASHTGKAPRLAGLERSAGATVRSSDSSAGSSFFAPSPSWDLGAGTRIVYSSQQVDRLIQLGEAADQSLGRFIYSSALPFSAVESPWLRQYSSELIAIGKAGGRMPTPFETANPMFSPSPGKHWLLPKKKKVGGVMLEKEVQKAKANAQKMCDGVVGVRAAGATVTTDGADLLNEPTYNIVFTTREGVVFHGIYSMDIAGTPARAHASPPLLPSPPLSLTVSHPPPTPSLLLHPTHHTSHRFEKLSIHGEVVPL